MVNRITFISGYGGEGKNVRQKYFISTIKTDRNVNDLNLGYTLNMILK